MGDIKDTVELHAGLVTEDLSVWVKQALRQIVAKLPDPTLENSVLATAETDSGSGVTVTGKRVVKVHKLGYEAYRIPPYQSALVDLDASNDYDAQNPVYYESGGLGYVKPGGGTVVTAVPPTVTGNNDPSFTTPSPSWTDAVSYFVLSRLYDKKARETRNLLPTNVSATKPSITASAPTLDASAPSLSALAPTIDASPPSQDTAEPLLSVSAPSSPSITASSPTLAASGATPAATGPSITASKPTLNASAPTPNASAPTPVTVGTIAAGDITAIESLLDELDALDVSPPTITALTTVQIPTYPTLTFTKPTITLDWATRWQSYYAVADPEMMAAVLGRKQTELQDQGFKLSAEVEEFRKEVHEWERSVASKERDLDAATQHAIAEYRGKVQLYSEQVVAKVREIEAHLQKVIRIFEVQKSLAIQANAQEQAAFRTQVEQESVEARIFQVEVEQERVEASLFQTEVEQESVKVQDYRADIELEGVKQQKYATDVRADEVAVAKFRAEVEQERIKVGLLSAEVEQYQADIAYEQVRVALFRAEVEQEQVEVARFRAEVEQEAVTAQVYAASVQLDQARVALFSAQIDQEALEVQIYRTQVEQESVEVQLYAAEGSLDEAKQKQLTATYKAQYEAFRAESARWFNTFTASIMDIRREMTPIYDTAPVFPSI